MLMVEGGLSRADGVGLLLFGGGVSSSTIIGDPNEKRTCFDVRRRR